MIIISPFSGMLALMLARFLEYFALKTQSIVVSVGKHLSEKKLRLANNPRLS